MRRLSVLVSFLALVWLLLARRRRTRALPEPVRSAAVAAPPAALPAPQPPRPPAPAAPAPGERFVSVPWTLVAAPPDKPELTMRCTCDERFELDRVDAQETPTQVFVTVLMRRRASVDDAPAPPRELEASVRLSRPLGARELVHAPADDGAAGGGEPSGPPLYP